MLLSEELQSISGRKRRFLLLRIIDVGTEAARQLCGITRGTYNTWCQNDAFVQLYRRRDELSAEYKQEALQLLRRSNQLQAVLLEEKVISKISDEIESGNYDLLKTNLAREVYSKLIADLDYQPKAIGLTWQQRIQNITQEGEHPQIAEGEIIDGSFRETDSKQKDESAESQPITESVPTGQSSEEET